MTEHISYSIIPIRPDRKGVEIEIKTFTPGLDSTRVGPGDLIFYGGDRPTTFFGNSFRFVADHPKADICDVPVWVYNKSEGQPPHIFKTSLSPGVKHFVIPYQSLPETIKARVGAILHFVNNKGRQLKPVLG